jgi:hypothetical protein
METADIISLALTGTLVLVTAVYAYLTWAIAKANRQSVKSNERAVDEMRRQTEATYRPYVVVTPRLIANSLFHLEIRNTGKTSAENLKLDIDRDFYVGDRVNEDANLAEMPAFKREIDTFPPEAELAFTLGTGLLAERDGSPYDEEKTPSIFSITATYSYLDKKVSETTTVDLTSYARTNVNLDPIERQLKETKEALEDIEEAIAAANQ